MIRRPPRSTRTYTLVPSTTLFRSPLTSGQFSYGPENDYHHLRASFSRKIAWNGDFSLTATGGRMSQNDYIVAPMACQGQFGIPVIPGALRSEEHTSELQSLMRISYAVFCLKKKKTQENIKNM